MVRVGDNWKCPYCGHAQVLDGKRTRQGWDRKYLEGWKNGQPALRTSFIVCANNDCKELTLEAELAPFEDVGHTERFTLGNLVAAWKLLPPSAAKPQPDCVPPPIRNDYYEACAIRDLSPKASATIVRRCIQGMIRDFCGISKKTLFAEIDELNNCVQEGRAPPGVQPDTVVAIDHVRGIGNIGAHMEADINVIVDVDADEAQILIELAELLFAEWYVAKETRTQRFDKLKSIADAKKDQKKLPPPEPAADS